MKTTGTTKMMTTQDWEICRDIRMNELDPIAHVDFQLAEILKFIGYGLLGFLIWLLKKFGEQHLLSMKELANELKEMRKELNNLSTRVTAVEIRTEKMRHDES